jgi:hypothetical protein
LVRFPQKSGTGAMWNILWIDIHNGDNSDCP